MSRLIFDFNNMMAERTGGKGFAGDELEKTADMAAVAYCAVGGKPLGFRTLPKGQDGLLDDILATAQDIRESFDNFVVLGHWRLGAGTHRGASGAERGRTDR